MKNSEPLIYLKSLWNRIPDQTKRLSILLVILLVLLIVARRILVPSDYGKYGHFRASAVDEIISQDIRYAGHETCAECHDDIAEVKSKGFHKSVACEVCHGPGAGHAEDPGAVELQAPRGRGYCPLCHEYLPSRPTGFPQIVSASHNPIKPCITCHEPHDPKPPEAPKECRACHATIARTKTISHHAYVPCTRCHEAREEHKVSPREFLPSKPKTREFCGGCHAEDASSPKGIPRIDMVTHGERYVCWQCHYPHLPEAR
ncbi:MAG: cytochrome c3 family protein [bacterium]